MILKFGFNFAKMCALICALSIHSLRAQMFPDQMGDGENFESCELEKDESQLRSSNIQFWPNARIPYTTSDNFEEKDHQVLNSVIADFHQYTCLRLEPRTTEEAYMRIFIERNLTSLCGSAQYCYNGESRRCRIGGQCITKQNIIHEIGHVACLEHEHVRVDRDEYLDFSNCTKPETIAKIVDSQVTRGNLYDYQSDMHYPCYTCVGKPKMRRGYKCRGSNKLGVLDADKLNSYYNCQGCHRHRWYLVDTLTSEEEASLVNFASQEGDQGPVYLCRGYRDASIITGRYIAAEKACYIGDDGVAHKITHRIQLFGLPGGPTTLPNATTPGSEGYALYVPPYVKPGDLVPQPHFIRMARDFGGLEKFVGVTWLVGKDGKRYTEFGRVGYFSYREITFPTPEREMFFWYEPEKGAHFAIIGCSLN